ncbi:MAG: M28 family peptidase [Planctomycetota bacterium]|jgi:glutaminyl-peptide cyclotransferase
MGGKFRLEPFAFVTRQTMLGRVFSGMALVALGLAGGTSAAFGQEPATAKRFDWAKPIPAASGAAFDQKLAFDALGAVCDLGTRVSGSEGMRTQQKLITEYFRGLDAEVSNQLFQVRHPLDGSAVTMNNLCVRWHPDRKKRVLICCHYDTRPFPDRDPVNPRGVFLGANDGASGVGLLAELGRHLAGMDGKWGVDFVFFDGEELVYVAGRDPMFLGSQYFAQQYAGKNWDVKYQYGVLIDMIADKDLQIYYEKNSMKSAARVCRSIWGVAKELGVKEFIPEEKHQIRDDHLPLNEIARIPTCDIIDFDYPNPERPNEYWHTLQDRPENCSAESLGKVGAVLLEWLRQLQKL